MGDLSVSVRYTQIYRNDTNGSFSTPGVVSAEYYFPSYLNTSLKHPNPLFKFSAISSANISGLG